MNIIQTNSKAKLKENSKTINRKSFLFINQNKAQNSSQKIAKISKVYLFNVVLESLILIGFAIGIVISRSINKSLQPEVIYYVVIAIYVTLCQLYFSFDSIFKENKWQFVASIVASGLVCIQSTYHYFWKKSSLSHAAKLYSSLGLTLFIVTLFFFLLFLCISFPIYKSFGQRIYKEIGAELQLQKRYDRYQLFITMLKFDLELCLLLFVMDWFFLFNAGQLGILSNILAFVFSLSQFICGLIFIRCEKRISTYFWIVVGIIYPVLLGLSYFFCYLNDDLVESKTNFAFFNSSFYQNEKQGNEISMLRAYIKQRKRSFVQFLIIGSIQIFCRTSLLISSIFVIHDFEKGLKRIKILDQFRFCRPFFNNFSADEKDHINRETDLSDNLTTNNYFILPENSALSVDRKGILGQNNKGNGGGYWGVDAQYKAIDINEESDSYLDNKTKNGNFVRPMLIYGESDSLQSIDLSNDSDNVNERNSINLNLNKKDFGDDSDDNI